MRAPRQTRRANGPGGAVSGRERGERGDPQGGGGRVAADSWVQGGGENPGNSVAHLCAVIANLGIAAPQRKGQSCRPALTSVHVRAAILREGPGQGAAGTASRR